MILQHQQIEFNTTHASNISSIFTFTFFSILKNTINFGTILFLVLFQIVFFIFSKSLFPFFPLLFLLVFILVALEETYHIAMLIILGKGNTITHLDITKIKLGFITILGGICVCYNGALKKSDIFYISLAGPFMPLFYVFVVELAFIILNFCFSSALYPLLQIFFYSSAVPLTSFIPIKNVTYSSDGYKIYSFIKNNNIQPLPLFKAIAFTLKSMLSFTFHRSRQ